MSELEYLKIENAFFRAKIRMMILTDIDFYSEMTPEKLDHDHKALHAAIEEYQQAKAKYEELNK